MYTWDFTQIAPYWELFLTGIGHTLMYTAMSIIGGLLVGTVVAFGRLSGQRWLVVPLRAYVELFRCTPALVQLIWFYYAMPVITGIQLSAAAASILSLTLYGGAFYSELIRGGIASIDVGQTEAARALGMRRHQIMFRTVLPQAVRRMLPALMNQSILQLKNTSLLSVLALPDLLYQGQAIAHDTFRPLESYTVVALIYLALLVPATLLARKMEVGRAPVHH